MLAGRPWSWYLATLGQVCVVLVGWTALPARFEAVDALGFVGESMRLVSVLQVAAGTLVVLYLFSGAVVDFFGVNRRTRWLPLVLEVAIAVGLLFGVLALIERRGAEPSAEIVLRLQTLGERRSSGEEETRFMLERLTDGAMEERVSAAWALGRSGRGDVIPQLLETSREDSNVNVRINAIGAVAELGGGEILADLVGFLGDRDPEIQSAALRGLAKPRFSDAIEEIGRFMLDNEALRGLSVDTLGNMDNAEAVPFLQQAATDSRDDVRTRVAYALGKLGDRGAVRTLIDMLQDQSWSVRANAAQALGMIGDPAARPALEALRDDPNEQVKGAAASALTRLP
jgi:HEAT repeat protein